MKISKITALFVAVMAIAMSFAFLPDVNNKVQAASTVKFVQAYDEYDNSYIAERFGLTFEEGKEYYFDYKLSTETEYSSKASTKSGKTTFEGATGVYDIRFYYTDDSENQLDLKSEQFTLVDKTEETSIYYAKSFDWAAYEQEIEEKLEGKQLSGYFYYPDLDGILVSDYFDYAALTKDVYYSRPNSTSFTKTSSSSFSLSQVGTYKYYVVAKDPTGTAFDIQERIDNEELTRKVDANGNEGWFDENDEMVVPIFEFYFSNIKEPEITISESEEGFIGLVYKDAKSSITIVAENEAVEYKLYYSTTDLSTGVENWASEGIEVVEADATEITTKEEVAFNEGTLYFTPDQKGYYYVVCRAADAYGEASAVTNAIVVANEFSEVIYETQWFKDNWLSVVFLAIAVLSGVGIIVLLFVKPKEVKEEEVTPVSKK